MMSTPERSMEDEFQRPRAGKHYPPDPSPQFGKTQSDESPRAALNTARPPAATGVKKKEKLRVLGEVRLDSATLTEKLAPLEPR